MSVLTKKAVDIFSPVKADGTPRPVSNLDAQVWGAELEALIDGVIAMGGKIYASKAELDADLSSPANTPALVIGDPVPAFNGLYRKIGDSGVGGWQRVGDVPGYQIIPLTNTGAGTANVLRANSALPIPQADRSAILLLNVVASNTGPVTLSVNEDDARPIRSNSGREISSGYLTSGMVLAVVRVENYFQLLSDVASAAIQEAAESAKVAAEAARDMAANYANDALAGGMDPGISSTLAIQELAIPAGIQFFTTGGYAVAGDGKGVKVRKVSEMPTHFARAQSADGAWWEFVSPDGLWDIRWFGGDDDNVTNNDDAWVAARSVVLEKGGVVTFPVHSTGVYYFATAGIFDVPIHSLGAIVFRGPSVENRSSTKVVAGTFNMLRVGGALEWKKGFDQTPDPFQLHKVDYITPGDLDCSKIRRIDCLTVPTFSTPWQTGDVWTATSTGITKAEGIVQFNLTAMTSGYWVGAFEPAVPGTMYMSGFERQTQSEVPLNAAFYQTETHWVAIYQDPASAKGIKMLVRTRGGSTTTIDVLNPSEIDQPAYNFRNANISIHLTKGNEFVVGLNGVAIIGPILTIDGSPVEQVGFGYYADGTSTNVFLVQPTKTSEAEPLAPKPQRILVFGDSITDPNYPAWARHMTSALQGSLGAQIERVDNIGHAGDASDAALAAITAAGVSGYSLIVGMIGTNDIQYGRVTSSYVTNLEAIIDLCCSNGRPLVLVAPPTFYSPTESAAFGGGGTGTQYANNGSRIRAAAHGVVAKKQAAGLRVAVVDAGRAVPPPFAKYLDWDFPGQITDPIVYDNLHLTGVARMYLGVAVARAAMGLLAPRPQTTFGPIVCSASWLKANWSYASGFRNNWSINKDGSKTLRMVIECGTGGVSPALTLPRHLRPTTGAILCPVSTGSTTVGQIKITSTGDVEIFGVSAGAYAAFEITYD